MKTAAQVLREWMNSLKMNESSKWYSPGNRVVVTAPLANLEPKLAIAVKDIDMNLVVRYQNGTTETVPFRCVEPYEPEQGAAQLKSRVELAKDELAQRGIGIGDQVEVPIWGNPMLTAMYGTDTAIGTLESISYKGENAVVIVRVPGPKGKEKIQASISTTPKQLQKV